MSERFVHPHNSVEERVIKIIRRELQIPPEEPIQMTTTLESLDFDSLNLMDIALEIEAEYQIEIKENEAEYFLFIGDLVRYVERRIMRSSST